MVFYAMDGENEDTMLCASVADLTAQLRATVIAILDERGQKRYREEMLAALPAMRQASSLREVERFIRQRKEKNYYLEGCA